MLKYRKIEAKDDEAIARIIRTNLEKFHLNIPGTVYFDAQLDHLSAYYQAEPEKRVYFVALGEDDQVIGGVGLDAFVGFSDCAELQKLYLDDRAKGQGYGKALLRIAEGWGKEAGYRQLYLETHSNLCIAMGLYEKLGYRQIDRPAAVVHSTMDHFYLKQL